MPDMTIPPAPASHREIMRVVGVLGPLQILSWGTTFYVLAVFGPAIAAETGWRLASISAGLSVGLVAGALASPYVGVLIDAKGGRGVLTLGSLVMAAGHTLLSFAASLPVYYAAWALLGLGMAMGLYDPAFAMLARLFRNDARRAIGALTLFGGFASTVGWPVATWLTASFGWRDAALVFAAIHLFIGLPAHRFLLPAEAPAVTHRDPEQTRPALPGNAGTFALVTFALATLTAATAAMSVHMLDMLGRLGMGTAAAVAIGALVGPSQVTGRILDMLAQKRIDALTSGRVAAFLIPAGLAILLTGGPPAAALFAVTYGMGLGITTIARGALPLLLFGPVGYGARQGRIALAILIAQAAAPILGAALIERYGAEAALAAMIAMSLLALAAFFALRRPAR